MNKWKNLLNAFFLIVVFSLTMYFVFAGQDVGQVIEYISQANRKWIVFGVFLVAVFTQGEGIIIYYMLRSLGYKIKYWHCSLYALVGFFFSCITPSATGGQPAQIYFMKKDKIPIPVATVILMIVTIMYKMVLVVVGVGVIITRPASLMVYLDPVWFWCCLGVALNVFCVLGMLVLVFHPSLATNLLIVIVRIWNKIFKVRKLDKLVKRIETSMEKYKDVAIYLREHKMVNVNVFLISVVQRLILFSVTYVTYISFGLDEISYEIITFLQSMISVSVDMLPLPGGMGMSESLFLDIYENIFKGELLLPGMLVSRGLAYYTQVILSAIMTVVAYFTIKEKK